MNDDKVRALWEDIEYYKSRKKYAECVKRMEEREKEVTDPVGQAILLTAKSTCAAQMGNLALAEKAAFAIDMEPLSPEMRNYVNLTRASISHSLGRLEQAESLFSAILASKEAHAEQQPGALCEAFARLGMLYGHKKRFAAALDLLQRASILMPDGDLRGDIGVWLGYCLQGLGRLDEAKECLRYVLDNGSGEMNAHAYYRLGAVQLQAGECEAAIDSFGHALRSLPHGGIAESDILAALQEAKEQQNLDPVDRPPSNSRAKPPIQ